MKNKELTFVLDEKQVKKAKKWIKKQYKKHGERHGTAGDRFSYKFTPTGLGVISSVIDAATGESKLLTNFNNW